MELTKKTTILFSPDLHARLTELARQTGTSIGHLVRCACEVQYGLRPTSDRVAAARRMGELSLPVTDPLTMKRQSVADPKDFPVPDPSGLSREAGQ